MIIYKKVIDISIFLTRHRINGKTIGLVPTMGALHKGHISLINESKKANNLTACSIFVNPTQFNDKSDLEKYPITLEADIAMLHNAGCDVLFLPSVDEIYPENSVLGDYDLGLLETLLEGKYRPGHFQGVCQVVHRLLDIIQPTNLFIGQKDYQQCMVIQKLIELKNIDTAIIICPTVREDSGLAMSSRNMRLSDKSRETAVSIYQSLLFVKDNIALLPIESIEKLVAEKLLTTGFNQIDYVEICNAKTLESLSHYSFQTPTVVLIAAFIDGVRLIDNMLIS